MRFALIVALLFTSSLALAQGPARTHAITPGDYASIATITQIAVSPDGRHVAYCEARWDKAEDNRKSDLWLVATDGKTPPRRLTGDRANDRNPKWSADGKSLLVLGNRKRAGETKPPHDSSTQVWSVSTTGGEPQPVTRVPGGVIAFDAAANTVFYSVNTNATDEDDFSKLRSKFPAEYGHGTRKVSEIYRLDLQSWQAGKIIAEKRYIREFAVTRDGNRLAMITAPDDQVVNSEGKSTVDVWEANTNKVTTTDMTWMKTAASPYPWLESLAWDEEGTRLAFCSIFDAYPAEIIQEILNAGKWTALRLLRPDYSGVGNISIRGYGSPLKIVDNKVHYLAETKGTTVRNFKSEKFGELAPDLPAVMKSHAFDTSRSINGFDFSNNGSPFELAGTASQMPEVQGLLKKPNQFAEWQNFTNVNVHTQTWKFPRIQHITWKAPDGTEVGGVLELPPDYKKGDKLPLVVAIHGGPTTSAKAELNFDPHNGRLYFAAHGYAVLCPNYRGSTGYGDKFVADLIGRENDIEVNDIIAGVQHLVKEGIADPERVGVMGWSNGGYLTNCLITRTDLPFKLKAASSGAGIVDTVAEWGFNDEPAYPIVFKKGLPWQQPDIYRKTSPTYDLGKAKTPTLIHVGGGDERCPPGHSRMLYRALKEYNKVPTELVVYPGEPHGLTKLSHRLAKMEWDLAWFDKYLLGKN